MFDDQDECYFKVPVIDRLASYADGLNLHQHLLIRQRVRKAHGEKWRDEHLLRVKAEIQAMIRDALKAKTVRDRKRAATISVIDSKMVFAANHATNLRLREASGINAMASRQHAFECFDMDELPELECTPNPRYQGVVDGH